MITPEHLQPLINQDISCEVNVRIFDPAISPFQLAQMITMFGYVQTDNHCEGWDGRFDYIYKHQIDKNKNIVMCGDAWTQSLFLLFNVQLKEK